MRCSLLRRLASSCGRSSPWARVAAGLFTAAAVVAQAADQPAPGRTARLDDGAARATPLLVGDARTFTASVVGDRVECQLEMAVPLADGMFTCVELWIDCDDKPKTGFDGRELRIRAAVGSRFQPSNAIVPEGSPRPIDHGRVSFTQIETDGSGGARWVHYRLDADPPTVDGKLLRFWFPSAMVRERGDRYSSRMAARVVVETSCSDQPVERLQVCGDDGMPIVIDGRADEWSAVRVRDPGDELHPVARCVDLTGLRVDHGPDCAFAVVDLADVGFATWVEDVDVRGGPAVTFLVEPLFPRYQEPYEVTIRGGRAKASGRAGAGLWEACANERLLEVRLPRTSSQNRLRVLALSDFVLQDEFAGELRLDLEAR